MLFHQRCWSSQGCSSLGKERVFFNKFIYLLFIFGCVGSSLLHVGFLQLRRAGATLCCGARASHCSGFSSYRAQALGARASVVVARGLSSCGSRAQQLWLAGFRAQAQQLWHTGLVAPWHVGSSRTRARTRVPCTGRWILNHCATREVPERFKIKLWSHPVFSSYINYT